MTRTTPPRLAAAAPAACPAAATEPTVRRPRAGQATALIVTLQMDAAAAARFTALRQAHFPAERNWLAAHITLFHALPLAATDTVLADVADLAGATHAFAMCVDRVVSLGGGVAYALASPQALRLRDTLAARWDALLGRQDRGWQRRLHITVQNKVVPAAASALLAQLERDFVADAIAATGIAVWHYIGGPWQPVAAFAFAAQTPVRP